MNIKNERTQQLVRKLASLTGESQTAAITEAVLARLDQVRNKKGKGLADRLLQIGQDCAARLKEPYKSVDHGKLLYNEKGLP